MPTCLGGALVCVVVGQTDVRRPRVDQGGRVGVPADEIPRPGDFQSLLLGECGESRLLEVLGLAVTVDLRTKAINNVYRVLTYYSIILLCPSPFLS